MTGTNLEAALDLLALFAGLALGTWIDGLLSKRANRKQAARIDTIWRNR